MDLTPIYNIAEACVAHNVSDVVLSPGSRNAPLTYAFTRHKQLQSYSISDERSAAFIALGIAVKSKKPVVLACTSGSAALNYAPAVAEAYFQNIPLIVFTADRPPEWIDQKDGQTIRQEGIYGSQIKKSYQCPVDLLNPDSVWHFERIINEALILAVDGAKGPVHINIPFREPFYPDNSEKRVKIVPRMIEKLATDSSLNDLDWVQLVDEWQKNKNKLIVGGQGHFSANELEVIGEFSSSKNVPLVGDVISNAHGIAKTISLADEFIAGQSSVVKKTLKPDLLITYGQSIISKNLKTYLRTHKPKVHWHIQKDGYVPDTYQTLTKIIPLEVSDLFKSIGLIVPNGSQTFYNKWQSLQKRTCKIIPELVGKQSFNELSAFYAIFDNLPLACDIHLANSMPVRWANMYGLDQTRQQVEIFCNRGTSGIDGCTSTAVGSSIKSDKTTLLITGDMAFFYDRNAFWNKYIPDNLRIIVLNNHGGGIFDIIEGPSSQPEHKEYFLTDQPQSAKAVAEEFGLKYFLCNSVDGLSKGLDKFWVRDGNAKILEVETNIETNTAVLKKLKKEIKKTWN